MEKATSDHGEIASLLSKLAFGVDKGENEEFLDHWLENARLIYVDVDGARFECANSREILQLIKSSYQPPDSHPCMHIVTAPIIDVDGDEARARYRTVHTVHGPPARPCGVGDYEAIVRRGGDGKWRVANLTQVQLLDFIRITPV